MLRLEESFFIYLFIFKLIESEFVLPRSSAVGVGFYGNSETNDGVYQLTYSLYGANRTLGSVQNLVSERCDVLFGCSLSLDANVTNGFLERIMTLSRAFSANKQSFPLALWVIFSSLILSYTPT